MSIAANRSKPIPADIQALITQIKSQDNSSDDKNVCYQDDLVITFEKNDQQRNQLNNNNNNEIKQSLIVETPPVTKPQTAKPKPIDQLILSGDVAGFSSRLDQNYYFIAHRIPYTFDQLAHLDPTGRIFRYLIDSKRSTDPLLSDTYGTKLHLVKLFSKKSNVIILSILKHYVGSIHEFTITSNIVGEKDRILKKVIVFNTGDDSKLAFDQKYQELTGRPYIENDQFEAPNDHLYGTVYKTPNYKIPSFKSICFATLLKQFTLNDQVKSYSIIRSLPFDLLQEFLEYCSNDQFSPNGFKLINFIKNQIPQDEFNQLLATESWLKSIYYNDEYYSKFYGSNNAEPPATILESSKQLLINVYNNYDKFKLTSTSNYENILFKSTVRLDLDDNNQQHSVVGNDVFLENFHNNTNGFFKNPLFDWSKTLVLGGIVTSSLIGSTKGFESSDIDIVFYNMQGPEMLATVTKLFNSLDLTEYSVTSTTESITISKHFPQRHIQLTFNNHHDIQHVLLGVDIESSCFAFDGTNVWTMTRGMEAMNHRCNIASSYGYNIRGENVYQRRLLKYLNRGFSIKLLHDDLLAPQLNDETYFVGHPLQNGAALLVSAQLDENLFKELIKKTARASLPYGPDWNKEKFDQHVQDSYEQFFDGYNSNLYPSLSDDPVQTLTSDFYWKQIYPPNFADNQNNWFDVLSKDQLNHQLNTYTGDLEDY